jgi:hypothetical protein
MTGSGALGASCSLYWKLFNRKILIKNYRRRRVL